MPKIPGLATKKEIEHQPEMVSDSTSVEQIEEFIRNSRRIFNEDVSRPLKPFWQTSDGKTVTLYQGEVLSVLKRMKRKSVQMIVTSPPYWALRDYGTGTWEGSNDPSCDHQIDITSPRDRVVSDVHNYVGAWTDRNASRVAHYHCPRCGANRIDEQLGSEDTPDKFVTNMVNLFREAREVLRDDGTLWLNLGDTYANKSFPIWKPVGTLAEIIERQKNSEEEFPCRIVRDDQGRAIVETAVEMPKGNLVGIPWRVALALQDDGWILRQDIIWNKPSPMPESVNNRCTKSHEYVFLFSKIDSGYFYDADAIAEEGGGYRTSGAMNYRGVDGREFNSQNTEESYSTRNKRSVWLISSQGYEGAHFATFPQKLIEPPILAGTSEHGCCINCAAPWKKVISSIQLKRDRPNDYVKRTGEEGTGNFINLTVAGVDTKTIGWYPTCLCNSLLPMPSAPPSKAPEEEHNSYRVKAEELCEAASSIEVQPCTVLDIFIGSGTTCCVSLAHGRYSIGIDLSEAYLRDQAIPRITGELLARRDTAHLTGHQAERLSLGDQVS